MHRRATKIPAVYSIADGVVQITSFKYDPELDVYEEFIRAFDVAELKGEFRTNEEYNKLLGKFKRLLRFCYNKGVFNKHNNKVFM